jgi:hypothetical protein
LRARMDTPGLTLFSHQWHDNAKKLH